MNSGKCSIKRSTHFEPGCHLINIISTRGAWACPKHIDITDVLWEWDSEKGEGVQKLCKICLTSSMDGALGYIMLDRLNC